MTPGQKRKTAKILSLIVAFSGVLVGAGWIFNIGNLKTMSPGWVSMKFDTAEGVNTAMAFHTAVLFVLLGVGLLCL